jgi:Zn-dependent protease with chaperone function
MGTAAALGFDPLEAARAVVDRAALRRALAVAPAIGLAVLLACALMAALLVRERPASSADEPWTERARRTFPMRRVLSIFSMFVALTPAALAYFALQRTHAPAERRFVVACVLAPSLLGMEIVRARVESRLHRRRITLARWLAYKTTWLPILAPHLVVALASAALLPHAGDPLAWALAAASLAALFASATGVLWIPLRALGVIRPPPPRLVEAVERATARTGVRPRAIHVVPTFGVPVANAFALPVLQHVAFTDEALALLDDASLTAIASHELGHVAESRSVAWGRSVLAFVLAPIAIAPVVHATAGLPGLIVAFALALLATRVYRGWAQKLERRADRVARRGVVPRAAEGDEPAPDSQAPDSHPGVDAQTYARALERVYERNLMPAVMAGRAGSHPHLYDRLVAAGVTPAYARPAPPTQQRELALGLVVLVAFAAGAVVAFGTGKDALERRSARDFAAQAEARVQAADLAGALALQADAARLSHRDAAIFARWAELLARAGDCARARERLAIAEHGERLDAASGAIAAARLAISAGCQRPAPRAPGDLDGYESED